MSALYEELGKSWKKLEKVVKSDAPIFLTVYEALHMKIYEPPHMNFGKLRSPGSTGQYREAPAASGCVGKRREASGIAEIS